MCPLLVPVSTLSSRLKKVRVVQLAREAHMPVGGSIDHSECEIPHNSQALAR